MAVDLRFWGRICTLNDPHGNLNSREGRKSAKRSLVSVTTLRNDIGGPPGTDGYYPSAPGSPGLFRPCLKYTFAELNHRVTQIARGLMAIGIQKGDHIGIWATNVPDWTAILFAAARIGAVLVTINTHYRPAELEYVLRQSDAKALIIIDGFKDIDYVQSVYELVPELKTCPRGLLESKRFPFLKYMIYLGTKQHRGMYTMRQVMEKMYLREITVVYGLTETSPGITQTQIDDPVELRVSTVGKAFEGVEVKIVDVVSGEALPLHQPGELCSRGYNTMRGYHRMPEETAKAIDSEGWLHTGDLAVQIEDGYYRITGRLKDMIIRGGENIYPKEVEDFLLGMKEIWNIQIVGVPSDKYGEEVVAFVQLHPGTSLEPGEIQDYCRGQIARYKIPKYIFFLEEYPMTASGKIQKYKLREMATELVGQQREEQSEKLPLSVL